MVIILPDPTTRHCPKHWEHLMTDSIDCIRCAGDKMIESLRRKTSEILEEALR